MRVRGLRGLLVWGFGVWGLGLEVPLQRPHDPDLELSGSSPTLHFACYFGGLEAVCLLLDNADKDKADNSGGNNTLYGFTASKATWNLFGCCWRPMLIRAKQTTMVQLRSWMPPCRAAWTWFVGCHKLKLTRIRQTTMAKRRCSWPRRKAILTSPNCWRRPVRIKGELQRTA